MKIFLLILPAILASGGAFAQQPRPLGLVWRDPRLAAPGNQVTIPLKDASLLPRSVDHSANMPPVGDQGSQGSCTAWAVGYYYKSYQEWLEHGWSLADPSRQFSPAFIYNQINGGHDYGSWFGDAFQLLCEQGGASMALAPYNAGDCTSWPSEAAYDSALPYRCQQWHWFSVSDDAGILAVKQRLDSGDNVVIGLQVYANYDNINSHDTTYCVSEISGESRGGHANCIVGYDDDKVTSDGPGAFRVVNSWGPGWGNGGYYWFSYQALKDYRTSYQSAFYSDDRIGYSPSLKLKVRLSHPLRSTVELSAGVGPASSPYMAKGFYSDYGGGPWPFPQNCMVFDLSEGTPYLGTTGGNNIYLRCRDVQADGQAGSIDELRAVQVFWGVDAESAEIPVAIGDDASFCYANLSLRYQNFSVVVGPTMDTVTVGGQASYAVSISPLHGFANPVSLQCQVSPAPASGVLDVVFLDNPLAPGDSTQMAASASPDAAPGLYQLAITATDPIDTIVHRAQAGLWVLGAGQAVCVGADGQMMAMARSIWPAVDSVWSVPPVIGANYQAAVIQSGAAASDTARLRQYLSGGGKLLLLCTTPKDLCAGSNLSSVSDWLGADRYFSYQGGGIGMVCHYDHPFGLPTILSGDTLGAAQYGYGWVRDIHSGAVSIAHLGAASIAVVALANDYGPGRSFWYTGRAGLGAKSDSLLLGFLTQPPQGASGPGSQALPDAPKRVRASLFPNPTPGPLRLALDLPGSAMVSIRLYDVSGRLVRTLHRGMMASGRHSLAHDFSRSLPSGLYFVTVESAFGTEKSRMLLVK